MGDPVTVGLTIASSVMSAGASISAGAASAKQAALQAADLEMQVEISKLQAQQLINQADDEFAASKAANMARLAASGIDVDSGSARAFFKGEQKKLDDEKSNIRLNSLLRRDRLRIGISQAGIRGRAALTGGFH